MRNVRMLFCGLCLLAGMFFCLNSDAAERYVYDNASLLTPEEREMLEETAKGFSEYWNMDFGVVTTDDAQGKTSRDYADDFYDTYFDITDERGGVLYLIDMDNREIYLSTCGQAIRYLTDERIERILDEAYAEIADGDYYGTFEAFFDATEDYLERGIPSNQYHYDTETGERDYYYDSVPKTKQITFWEAVIAGIAALAAALGTCGFIVGKYRLKFEDFHYDAYTDSDISLSVNEDRLVNTFVTHRHIPKNDGNSGSGSSSVHRSSGGTSHGGGGRSF